MVKTSQFYKDAIKQPTRSSTARIVFGVHDITAVDDLDMIAYNTAQPFTDTESLTRGIRTPDFKIATLEPDQFKLDGSFSLTPDDVNVNDRIGWWSGAMSNVNGEFEATVNIGKNIIQHLASRVGYSVTKLYNVVFEEYNTDKATRMIITGAGTDTTPLALTLVSFTQNIGRTFATSVKIKNLGTKDVGVHDNNGSVVWVKPNEVRYVSMVCTGNGVSNVMFNIRVRNIGDEADFLLFEPQTEERGYVTDYTPDSRYIPELDIYFGTGHNSIGVGIFFDPYEYCTEFDVTWYGHAGQILAYEMVFNNNTAECNIAKNVYGYDRIVIRLYKTNKPSRYARIMEIAFGLEESFDSNTITQAAITEEVDPSSGTLSINTLKFTVLNENQRFNMLNPEGIYSYLQRRQKITAQSGILLANGEYEYIPMGVYYLSDWKNSTGLTATLEATDVVGLLDKTTYFSSPFWNNTLAENIIRHIIDDAGVFSFSISPEIQVERLTGYIPVMSHREALMTVLLASRAMLRVERDGALRVMRANYSVPVEMIENDTIIGMSSISQKPLITTIETKEFAYSLNSSAEKLHEVTFNLIGTETVLISYGKAAVNVVVSVTGVGAIVGTPKISAVAVEVTIQGNGTLTLVVNGRVYSESSRLVTATIPTISGEMLQIATMADNKLIARNALQVAQHVLSYYQKRIKQSFNYWDDPSIQVGDCVSVETMFSHQSRGIIERQDITFAPSLKAELVVVG